MTWQDEPRGVGGLQSVPSAGSQSSAFRQARNERQRSVRDLDKDLLEMLSTPKATSEKGVQIENDEVFKSEVEFNEKMENIMEDFMEAIAARDLKSRICKTNLIRSEFISGHIFVSTNGRTVLSHGALCFCHLFVVLVCNFVANLFWFGLSFI